MSSKWLKWAALPAGALILAGIAGISYVRLAPRRTPPGQPPLVHLAKGDLSPFVEAFNAKPDTTRILALLSPT